ncbi:hypothetical protein KY335_03725 [Candidatus Woesearchaeota archaeon]|nr:hypothetical protein [Candidatus Woesearchaeota archaeon]
MKKLCLLLIIGILMLTLVSIASADELAFKNIDAYVNGQKFSNLEQDTTDFEIRPGEELRLVVEIENLFDEREDIEIDGIEMTVTIHDIRGNGDDLYYEFRDFGLDAGEDKDKEVVFDIPEDALTGDYILEIEAEGKDDNKEKQEESFVFPLHLRKRAHDILVSQPVFDPAIVDCGEMTTLTVDLENRGLVTETVKVLVTNKELGIEKKYEATLKVGSLDQYNKIEKDFLIDIPEDARKGTYEFEIIVEYFNKKIVKTVVLTVACDTEAEQAPVVNSRTTGALVGKGVANVPEQDKGVISMFFANRGKEIAILAGLGIIVLVLILVIIGFMIRR